MTRKGGINKTRKAVAKRFKVTGTGKVLRRKQGKRHILQKKSSKRKRQLGKVALVDETQVWAEPAFRLNRGNARLMPSFPPAERGAFMQPSSDEKIRTGETAGR